MSMSRKDSQQNSNVHLQIIFLIIDFTPLFIMHRVIYSTLYCIALGLHSKKTNESRNSFCYIFLRHRATEPLSLIMSQDVFLDLTQNKQHENHTKG